MRRKALWLWSQRIARLVLGTAFLYAGAIKIVGPKESARGHKYPRPVMMLLGQTATSPGVEFAGPIAFRDEIRNYQLGRYYWVIHPAAIALPWIEVSLGLAMILGVWLVETTVLVWGLLLFFNFMVATAMYRGLDINCGCFGGDQKVGWRKLTENFGLILLGFWVLLTRQWLAGGLAISGTGEGRHREGATAVEP